MSYPAPVLALIAQARKLNAWTIYAIYTAIATFLLFGTLKSLFMFKDSTVIYYCFYYLPYALIGLTIPVSLYIAFILYRYRLSQPNLLLLFIGLGLGLFFVDTYVAFSSWIGVAFFFRVSLKRFFNFIDEKNIEK